MSRALKYYQQLGVKDIEWPASVSSRHWQVLQLHWWLNTQIMLELGLVEGLSFIFFAGLNLTKRLLNFAGACLEDLKRNDGVVVELL